jgi:hypothetical protein
MNTRSHETELASPRERTARRVALALVVFSIALASAFPAAAAVAAEPARSTEHQVKAAFLLNFAQFIQWPDGAFTDAKSPIVVGVLGDDPFGATLEQTFQGQSVQGRSLIVQRSRQPDELKGCHLLFISSSESARLSEILASLGERSIVTVGESADFARRGGVINFYIESSKVRFEINAGAAERKGLKISSQLLKRAKIVGSTPSRRGAGQASDNDR